MTLWELLRACWRSWPVVLIGALVTAGIGFVAIRADGVYYTRTELAFLAPTRTDWPNALRTQSDSIIITAGTVAMAVTGADQLPKFASPEATLVGEGVRDGWTLRLPDTGGQWASNFATQRLVLEIVGPTREAVAARQQAVTEEVARTVRALQEDQGAQPAGLITAIPTPESTVIFHVAGNRFRALGMTAMLGVSVTLACVVLLERRRFADGRHGRHAGVASTARAPVGAARGQVASR